MVEKRGSITRPTTGRLLYVDIAKGIGILLVILGHMIPRGMLWNTIYGFHMPLFIFLSGIFEKKSFSGRRLFKLLLSYLCLAAIGSSFYYLIYEFGSIYYFKQTIYNILVGGYSPGHGIYPVEALWFIPCLMLITLIWHLVMLIKHDRVRHTAVFVIAACGILLMQFRSVIPMLFNFDISLVLLPFFYGASICKAWLEAMNSLKTKTLLIVCIVTAAVYFMIAQFNGEINIYRGTYGASVVVFYLESVLGIVAALAISVLISRHALVLSNGFQMIGQHTLVIMGIHQLLILFLERLPFMGREYPLLLFLVVSASSFGVSYLWQSISDTIMNRRKCKV